MSEHGGNKNDDELIHPLAKPFLWLEAKWLKSSMIYILGAAALALAAIDFFHHRHEYVPFAETYGYYAWWGFGSFALAVMGGWIIIRGLLGRDEDYWEKGNDDD